MGGSSSGSECLWLLVGILAAAEHGERVGDVDGSTVLPADVLQGVPAHLRRAENTSRQTAQ